MSILKFYLKRFMNVVLQDMQKVPIYNKVTQKTTTVSLHKFIIPNIPKGHIRDHINGNKLDNRRSNLQVISQKDNVRKMKKSSLRGVRKVGNSYTARIKVDYTEIYLGSFKSQEEAINAYNIAAEKYFGKYRGIL